MSDYSSWQAFLRSGPGASEIIMEMKRLLSVKTDGELAERLGKTQSAVAHWRRKKSVPEAVLLEMNDQADPLRTLRAFDLNNDLRALMMRAATFHVQRQQDVSGTWRACLNTGIAIDCLFALVADTVEELERITGKRQADFIDQLFTDTDYLTKISDWLDVADLGDTIGCGAVVKPNPPILPQLAY